MTTINTIEDLVRLLDEHPHWAEALRVRLLTRELIELPEKFAQFVEQTNQRFEEIDQRFEGIDRRFDRVEASIEAIRVDIGTLKAGHAQNAARRQASLIAEDMGFSLVRILTLEDVGGLLRGKDTSGIPANALRSFRLADLILEVEDIEGTTCYVAVEVSFTINGRDTTRAIRNAAYLARFSGQPAFAGVAGGRIDERIQTTVDSGDVFWYRMDDEALEVE